MRRLTDEELAHLSLLGDGSPWPVLEFGPGGEVLYANPAATAAAASAGIDDLRVFLPDDPEALAAAARPRPRGESAPAGDAAAHSYREITVGERTYDATFHVSPGRERVLVYALDVTERKQAEDALRLTQLSVDRAADLIHWIAPDGRLVYVSDSNCRRHGYTREEMLALTIFDLDPTMDEKTWAEHWRDLGEHGSLTFETLHKTKDGEVFPLEVTANYVEHNGKAFNFAFARDVSARKEMERSLRLTQYSLDIAEDYIFWITPDGRLEFASEATCRRLGYSRDELLTMTIFDVDPEAPQPWEDHWRQLKEEGSLRFETVHKTKDGEIFPVEITASYVAYGGQEYDFGYARDITARKKADEALRLAKEQAEAANRDLEKAVERANRFTQHNADLYEVAQRRNRELEALLQIAAAVTSASDVDSMLAVIVQTLMDALGVYWCAAYDFDGEAGKLRLTAHSCIEREDSVWQKELTLSDVPAMGDAVLQKRITALYSDDEHTLVADLADMRRCGDLCQLFVPMAYGGQVVGLLYAGEVREYRRFGEEDLRLATTIAAQSAAAIETARAYAGVRRERERIAQRNATLSALVDLSTQMRGMTGEDELLALVGRVVTEALGFTKALVYLYDPGADEFKMTSRSVAAQDPGADEYTGLPVPGRVMRGFLADARRISSSLFVDHHVHEWTQEELDILVPDALGERAEGEWHAHDCLFVPMTDERGGLIGYLEAYDPTDRKLPTEVVAHQIEVFANKAAGDIELRRLNERLAEQARTDGLTGLINRRALMERLGEEVAKAHRFSTHLSVLMLDIDDFKQYNDRYGHPRGDDLLKTLADVLREGTRDKVDVVARYGGEEFVIVLPSTPAAGAESLAGRLRHVVSGGSRTGKTVAEHIRGAMADQRFEGDERGDVRVTVSVGVASYPEHGVTPDELISNSDKALYVAKRLGKNRTCIFGADGDEGNGGDRGDAGSP